MKKRRFTITALVTLDQKGGDNTKQDDAEWLDTVIADALEEHLDNGIADYTVDVVEEK